LAGDQGYHVIKTDCEAHVCLHTLGSRILVLSVCKMWMCYLILQVVGEGAGCWRQRTFSSVVSRNE